MRIQSICLALAIVLLRTSATSQWVQANSGLTGDVRFLTVNCSSLFAAAPCGVYLSSDDGMSWSLVSAPLPNTNGVQLQQFVANNTHLFLGRGHAYVSAINGASWSYSESGLTGGTIPGSSQWVQSIAVSGTKVFVGTAAGHFVSTDNGNTWNASGLVDYDIWGLAAAGTDVYASLKGGSVHYSSNGGANWSLTGPGLPDSPPYGMSGFAFWGPFVYAITYSDALYRSEDPSAGWVPANIGLPNNNSDAYLSYSAAGIGSNFFAGSYGGVFMSTDGIHWTSFNEGLPPNAEVGGGGNQGLVVGGTHLLAIVHDATGQTVWRRPLADALPVQLAKFVASQIHSNQVQLQWKTITETNNYGFEVQKSKSPPAYLSIQNVFIPGHGTTMTSFDYSWIDMRAEPGEYYRLKQIDLDGTAHFSQGILATTVSGLAQEVVSPTQFALEQNYPNPFNPTTKIRYSLAHKTHVTLEVFNTLGQHVETLVNTDQESGLHEATFEPLSPVSGIYFYRLKAGDFVQTRKLLLLR